jgi:hypothetical protein
VPRKKNRHMLQMKVSPCLVCENLFLLKELYNHLLKNKELYNCNLTKLRAFFFFVSTLR